MAFDGSGTFNRLFNWANDRDAGVKIRADRMDSEMDGMATGLTTAVTKDGQTNPTANLPMAGFRHTGVGDASARDHYGVVSQIQDGGYVHATAAGTADVLTLNITPSITAYATGQTFTFKAASDNTGAATLNVDAVGAKAIRKIATGSDEALAEGDIQAGGIYTVTYDADANSAAGAWILHSPSPRGAELINETTVSGSPTSVGINFTAGKYKTLELRVFELLPGTASALQLVFRQGGSNVTSAGAYSRWGYWGTDAGTVAGRALATDTGIPITAGVTVRTTAPGASGRVLINPSGPAGAFSEIAAINSSGVGVVAHMNGKLVANSNDIDGIAIFFASGTMAGGLVQLWGYR